MSIAMYKSMFKYHLTKYLSQTFRHFYRINTNFFHSLGIIYFYSFYVLHGNYSISTIFVEILWYIYSIISFKIILSLFSILDLLFKI